MNVSLRLQALKNLAKKLYVVSDEERLQFYTTLKVLTDELSSYCHSECPKNEIIPENIEILLNAFRVLAHLEDSCGVADEEQLPRIYKALKALGGADGFGANEAPTS